MLAILSAILGFAGPFIPEVIKLFRQKADNAHELAVLQMQAQLAEKQHLYRMEEISSQADIAEMQTLRQPQQSFGVQILDAAAHWPKMVILPVFYLFAVLDFINGIIRPDFTDATNIESLLDALERGKSATQAGILVSPKGTIWRFSKAPPRQSH